MKKRFVILTLGTTLLLTSMTAVFAEDTNKTTRSNPFKGNGFGRFHNAQNLSVEERLAQKITILDQMIKDGKITKDAGDHYKKIITERMNACTGNGENRDKHERLGIGFGRMMGKKMGLKQNFTNDK